MADQTRKPKPKKDQEAKAEEKTKEKKKSDIDDLLDEIDEVLEKESEEFVRSFVQKGGQLWIFVAVSAFGIMSYAPSNIPT
jgi:prokaryotic ubiquitin-like protein Pup